MNTPNDQTLPPANNQLNKQAGNPPEKVEVPAQAQASSQQATSPSAPTTNPPPAQQQPQSPLPPPKKTSTRGFASMDAKRQREIASKGGQAAHQSGRAHEFDSREAAEAGRKGGFIVSQNRQHMARIGAQGGRARALALAQKNSTNQPAS